MRSLSCLLLQGLLTCLLVAAEPQGGNSGSLRRIASAEWTDSGIALDRLGGFEKGTEGKLVQLTRLSSPGAKAVKARLANLRLPEGAVLYIYGISESGDYERIQGPYTASGPTASGEFWSLPVRGEDLVLELQVAGEPVATLPYDVLELAATELTEVEATEGSTTTPSVVTARGTAYYRGFNVEYEVKNGVALIEGDIEIGSPESLEPARLGAPSKGRQSIAITGRRWPSGVMPYVIEAGFPNAYRITDAINHWNTMLSGTISIVPRTNQSAYVIFRRPADAGTCSATVGYTGSSQSISLGDNCSTGNTIHEIGHALGLFHEQCREDRDRFVSIQWANIQSGLNYNFDQLNSTADDVGTYDYNSIMHYPAYAFSANGLPTIVTIPEGIPIGQRSGLSAGDVAGVRAMYQTSTTTNPVPPPPSPTPTPTMISVTIGSNPAGIKLTVDGATVTAPYTTSWGQGTAHTIGAPNSVNSGGQKLRWVNWSNGGPRNQTITAGSTTMFVANFSSSFSLRADVAVQGTGTVTVNPQSPDGYYDANAVVSLEAVPATGYCFAGWTGLLPGTPSRTSLTISGPMTAIANFIQGGGALQNPVNSLVARVGGGNWKVGTVSNSCPVSIRSSAPWLSGNINGSNASVKVEPYRDGTEWYRSGSITFGTHTITVWQFKY